jgi:hypothetical protein
MEQGENQSVAHMVFHDGQVPTNFTFAYERFLFNTEKHRILQSKTGWAEFHFLDQPNSRILISSYFFIENGIAKSPARAPFGGFEFGESTTPELLSDFISQVEKSLRMNNVQEIEILCPPELYSTNQPLLTTLLLNSGFDIPVAELSACIIVDERPLSDKMNKDKKARLRQCVKSGLTFKKINLEKLKEVYTFIEQCRTKQERKLSMPFKDLSETVEALPKSFFQVGVFDKKKMIGACICVRVKSNIVYTFYSAHDPDYDTISPRVFLLSNLYDWCAAHKVTLLDLGTSALEGKPNFPLLDFKMRVGATLTPKFKFKKRLG